MEGYCGTQVSSKLNYIFNYSFSISIIYDQDNDRVMCLLSFGGDCNLIWTTPAHHIKSEEEAVKF